ncbi:hypothetical protein LLE49_18905 [Alicyclobacillus tolerans]|uniref:hypothetical protein n=1 Tax=Alicyclobacillus tolerans TaxID=90970 RepID=UPI001F2D3DCC|nr:hypothetical protein [Alicyclobacillus tolerans]MCF8566794.1 hypothetical protein [Alicyclobacillus tolerans]
MQLQKAMAFNPRADFLVEAVQMVSGLLLVLFLWVHMLFVASIWLGVGSFNTLAGFMDKWGLLPLTIVFLVIVFLSHIGAVMRRMPRQYAEQRVVWKHAKLIHHKDTWSWVFQSITGSAIIILAIVHIAIVSFAGINAHLSSLRVQTTGFLIFYVVLLLLSEYHASVGLYRIFVKWGFVNRHSMKRVLNVISLLMIVIGAGSLWILYTLGA